MNYKNGIQVEGGWTIESNVFIDEEYDPVIPPFDSTLMISAVNYFTGKNIYIQYDNEDTGYSLNYYIEVHSPNNCNSIYSHKTLNNDHNIENIYSLLQQYLNPSKKKLIPLKISSWTIIHNNFLETEDSYEEIEFLFSAIREKLFIDVSYSTRTEKPYHIYMGLSKYHIGLNLQKVPRHYKELFLEKKEEVVTVINNFLTGLEWSFS